jgi:hypothetical protein
MGLDMYIYQANKRNIELDENNLISKVSRSNSFEEIAYWRKNPAIHDWMEKLYFERGGKETFNGVYLYLSEENLIKLKEDIENFNLDYEASGFFFGKSISPLSQDFNKKNHENDIELVEKTISVLKDDPNSIIVYDSSW